MESKIEDFDFGNILVGEKSYKNISVYDVSYKTFFGSKSLPVRFDEVSGFTRIYDEIRYLLLLAPENHDAIYNRFRYLINQKSDITYVCFL